jgi:glucose/arabinose dehydrogenase
MIATVRVRGAAAVALAVAFVAAACHHNNPRAQRVVASPSHTPVVGLETPAPSASAKPPPSSRSSATITFATARPTPNPGDLAKAKIKLTQIATLNQPLGMAVRSHDDALYVVEKGGTVHAIRSGRVDPTPVLDISSEVSTGSEQGLLGLAFSPDGSHMYVYFTNATGNIVLREYLVSGGRAVVSSMRQVLTIAHSTFPNHNGGNIVFGPDGFLYIGVGDGGSEGDPNNNGQNRGTLLAKMLRINPAAGASHAYQIPSTNPYASSGGRCDTTPAAGVCAEIWAYGLRNPWRYSFDRTTGDMWIGDVGQDKWEEIDYQPASGKGGDNYGWSLMEGTHRYKGGPPANHHAPIYEYSHDGGNCAVTGGYVYRGRRISNLDGAYVFADECVGRLRAFVFHDGLAAEHRFLGPQVSQPASFGQDQFGELYVLSLSGGVYRIDPA